MNKTNFNNNHDKIKKFYNLKILKKRSINIIKQF